MTDKTPPRLAVKQALLDLQQFGQLVYYPSKGAWGARRYSTRAVQGLVDRGLAWCGPLAAYPTVAGMRYGGRAKQEN